MSGRDLIIEAPDRRSRFLRWRDGGLTILLWSAWSRPTDALVRLAAGSAGDESGRLWDIFARDLADASGAAGVLIVMLYAWGGYGRLQHRAEPGRLEPAAGTLEGCRPRGEVGGRSASPPHET